MTLRSNKIELIYQDSVRTLASLQPDSSRGQSGGGGSSVWTGAIGHPFQTSLSVHRRTIDYDGSCQS